MGSRIGDRAMTGAERVARHRQRKRAEAAAAASPGDASPQPSKANEAKLAAAIREHKRALDRDFEERKRQLDRDIEERMVEVNKRMAAMAAAAPPPAEKSKTAEAKPFDPAPLLGAVRALIVLHAERGGGLRMRRATRAKIVKGLHPDHVVDAKLKPLFDDVLKIFNDLRIKITDETPEERQRKYKAAAEKAKATREADKARRAKAENNPAPRPPPTWPMSREELEARREEVRRENSERAKRAAAARAANKAKADERPLRPLT